MNNVGSKTLFNQSIHFLRCSKCFHNVYFSKQPEEETENVFKVLSRPKSINSLYSYENQVKRQKARPNTAIPGNVIPKEPEQPKAHPRITSGKPRLPTRGMTNE